MAERRVHWEFIFVAFVLTVTIMAGMFFAGQALNERKVNGLQSDVTELAIEREAQDIARRLADRLPRNNCEALEVATRQTIEDIRNIRTNMQTYEQSRKLSGEGFTTLKKRYTNLLLEYWLTAERIDEQCDSNVTTILYLYSDKEQCPRCTDQGTVLTKYRRMYEKRLLIFPLDTTLGMRHVEMIISAYNITRYPAIIVEGRLYQGFQDNAAMRRILDRHMNASAGS